MTSTDREILVTIYENQVYLLQELQGQGRRLEGIESRIGAVETEIVILKHDAASLQASVYWVLAAVGIFIASLAVPAMISSLVSLFRKPQSQNADPQSIVSSLTDAFMKGLAAGREHSLPRQ